MNSIHPHPHPLVVINHPYAIVFNSFHMLHTRTYSPGPGLDGTTTDKSTSFF